MESREYKILWISDIHFSEKYEVVFRHKPALEIYFSNFINKVKELIIADNNRIFDYIFLTGDLAQAGIEADYKLLFSKFLKPLLDLLKGYPGKKPKVIVIPGNHDVDWQKSTFLVDYVKGIEPGKKEEVERAVYLEENILEFKKLFTDYRKFLMEYVIDFEDGTYKEFFNIDNSVEFFASPEYREHRLFGYVVDHNRRLIINLLNTAWYSLGGKFNSILADVEADQNKWNIYAVENSNKTDNPTIGHLLRKHTANRLKQVLNKKEYISEYNNQITGINLFELTALRALRKEYSEYFVITCMHHPFNWLRWNEQYAFDIDDNKANAMLLAELVGMSNLILTGHEHVPKQINGEMKSESSLMLKSGCFLFDNQHNEGSSLKNGWFSVLHIDPDRATIRQDKHYYLAEESTGNWKDLLSNRSQKGYYKLRKQNDGYHDDGSRASEVIKMVYNTTSGQLKTFLNSVFTTEEQVLEVKNIQNDPNAHFFSVTRDGRSKLNEICILVRVKNAYTTIRDKAFFEQLIKVAAKSKATVNIFRFVILDLFVEEPNLEKLPEYQKRYYQVKDRSLQLQLRTTIADDMFDVMRYELFVDFEKRFAAERQMPAEFELIRDAMFINTIIPFWVAENIWRSAGE